MKVKKLFILLLVFIMVFNTYTPVEAAKVKTVKASVDKSNPAKVKIGKSKIVADCEKANTSFYLKFTVPATDTYIISLTNPQLRKSEPDEYTTFSYTVGNKTEVFELKQSMHTMNGPGEHTSTIYLQMEKGDDIIFDFYVGYPSITCNLSISKAKDIKYQELFFENGNNMIYGPGKYYLIFSDINKKSDEEFSEIGFTFPADGKYKFDFYNFRCNVKGCMGKKDYACVNFEDTYIYYGKDTHYTDTVSLDKGAVIGYPVQNFSKCKHGAKLTLKVTKVE